MIDVRTRCGWGPSVARISRRAISIWLSVCTVMVLGMIMLGGFTRVTRSGLSITTWDPILGAIPPLGDDAWRDAFARYRSSPEGALVNAGMTLSEFRAIYLVEYSHRLLGRVIGLVLGVPLVFLVVTRRMSWQRARPLVFVLALGLVQGIVGWWMVASGLVDAPHVSPFRLTAHLVVGMTLLAALAWCAIEPEQVSRAVLALLGVTMITIALGALMAGFHAGLVCPTFPTMNGAWIPDGLRASPSDAWTIHFAHRAAAFVVVGLALALAGARVRGAPVLSAALATCALAQLTLGALLVLRHVPPALAVLHQGNAGLLVVLLVALVRHRGAERVVSSRTLTHEHAPPELV